MRLIGTVYMYFKKHSSSFSQPTPRALFHSLVGGESPLDKHKRWLACIRKSIWDRIDSDDELLPTVEALQLHWKHSCWVSTLWSKANSNKLALPDIINCGWKVENGKLEFEWDSEENMKQIRHRVHLLFKGCTCKKGCTNRECGCQKNGKRCGPGCTCQNCKNMPGSAPGMQHEVTLEVEHEELLLDSETIAGYNEELISDYYDNNIEVSQQTLSLNEAV